MFVFRFFRSGYWSRSSNKRRKASSVSSSCPGPLSLPLSPSLLILLSSGWSLSLRSEHDSVNEVVAVNSRGEQTGRKKEETPDVGRSGKDMSKCLSLLGISSFPVEEHNTMFARMSFSSSPSFFIQFFLNDQHLHCVCLPSSSHYFEKPASYCLIIFIRILWILTDASVNSCSLNVSNIFVSSWILISITRCTVHLRKSGLQELNVPTTINGKI